MCVCAFSNLLSSRWLLPAGDGECLVLAGSTACRANRVEAGICCARDTGNLWESRSFPCKGKAREYQLDAAYVRRRGPSRPPPQPEETPPLPTRDAVGLCGLLRIQVPKLMLQGMDVASRRELPCQSPKGREQRVSSGGGGGAEESDFPQWPPNQITTEPGTVSSRDCSFPDPSWAKPSPQPRASFPLLLLGEGVWISSEKQEGPSIHQRSFYPL